MKRVLAAITLALLSGVAFSQASAPAEKGGAAASAPAPSQGIGPGPHGRMMRFDAGNTPGWSLMTPEERIAHRDKMQSFKTVDECRAYHDDHVKQMEARAKEQKKSFRRGRGDPCTMMGQRGLLK